MRVWTRQSNGPLWIRDESDWRAAAARLLLSCLRVTLPNARTSQDSGRIDVFHHWCHQGKNQGGIQENHYNFPGAEIHVQT
ncbi:hypothetical protein R3I94_005003 [Phoxinus phoxinus]|uniref:Uncharacterized protein n=1 Tax=Phoxinus phoxinus TaxID=58324 RepID=A0AAN9D5D6_9TELE